MFLNRILLMLFTFLIFQSSTKAQHFNDKRVSSLIINKNDSLTFTGDSLLIDTLTMYDHSKLKLLSNTYVLVKNAFLGENVHISSSGHDGQLGANGRGFLIHGEHGQDGTLGKDLFLIISFNQLGSLLISSDGGDGGGGGNGLSPSQNNVSGERGFNGGNGGKGGEGKNAGNITLYYKYKDFIPRFNREGPHSIHFSMLGGHCGKGGLMGDGGIGGPQQIIIDPVTKQIIYRIPKGPKGTNGLTSNECFAGKDGNIYLKKLNKTIN